MFNTGTNRIATHSELLAAHEISRDFSLRLGLSVLNMHHSACTSCIGPAKTKWQRTSSLESDEYRYEFGVINSDFTSDSILMVREE